MKIAVLREAAGETRVAAIAETVKKFIALGAEVAVESGAGEKAGISDKDFKAAGASVAGRAAALKGAGIILCISGPDPATLKGAEKGALLVGALDPARRGDDIAAYARAGLDPLAMESWTPDRATAVPAEFLSCTVIVKLVPRLIGPAGAVVMVIWVADCAVNVTGFPEMPEPDTVARRVFGVPVPSVQLPTVATPSASVTWFRPVAVPPPPITANVTAVPTTGFPLASFTRTLGCTGTLVPWTAV